MKLVTEYLEQALHFHRMAAEATDPTLKESLERQAIAYRKLAVLTCGRAARSRAMRIRPGPS
jgi:hypothetical protein